MADKSIITVREVAAYLQIGFRSVYWLAQRGDLPGRKVLGRWRFHVKDIDAWIRDAQPQASQRAGSPSHRSRPARAPWTSATQAKEASDARPVKNSCLSRRWSSKKGEKNMEEQSARGATNRRPSILSQILLAGTILLLATAAVAQEDSPATLEETPKPMVTCCHLWLGAVTTLESPYLTVGITLDHGVYLAAGASFSYDGNGATGDHVVSGAFLYGGIMLKNELPFSMGPELTIGTDLAPDRPFSTVFITPGWNLNYAPWNAPIAVGAGIGVRTVLAEGREPVVSLSVFPFRLTYIFY
jgi:excisionase family DNA binding protein